MVNNKILFIAGQRFTFSDSVIDEDEMASDFVRPDSFSLFGKLILFILFPNY